MARLDSIVKEAFEFAFDSHQGAHRKGSEIPYLCHPMDAASTLMKNGASQDAIAAGLLHDVVEDAGVTLDTIEERFGKRVMELVCGASEPEELRAAADEKATWKTRKQHTIEFITTAGREMKMVSLADKLSNIRDMMRDHLREGDAFWERFNAPKEEQAWYYNSMLQAFSSGESLEDLPMHGEFECCVARLFG